MKNTKYNKPIIICSLSTLCIAILIGAFFLTREPKSQFEPVVSEEPESQLESAASEVPESMLDNWSEISDTNPEASLTDTSGDNQITGTLKDKTQEIISEDESETIVDLSGSQVSDAEEKPTAAPTTEDDNTNPDKQPDYSPSVPQTIQQEESSASHAGQVYDPVFGWVTPSPVQQDTIDSDGDINKQVGTMGN